MAKQTSNLPNLEQQLDSVRVESSLQEPRVAPLGATPSPSQTPNTSAPAPMPPQSKKRLTTVTVFLLIALLLLAGLLGWIGYRVVQNSREYKAAQSSATQYDLNAQPLQDIASSQTPFDLRVDAGSGAQFTVNGQFNLNGRAVFSSTTRPTNPIAGELWFQEGDNKLWFYNGTQYVDITNAADVNNQIAALNTTLQNVVNSIQGQTGQITVQGTADQINVATNGSTITLSLPQNIAPTSSPQFAGINLTGVGTQNGQALCDASNNCNSVTQGGNSFGTDVVVGALNNSGVQLISNGISRLGVSNAGVINLGSSTTDRLVATAQVAGGTPFVFQGATDDGNTLSLVVADPTANQTVILPNASGTVCLDSGNCAGSGGYGNVLQGGNSFTATMVLGTNDDFGFNLKTNGTDRVTISNTGAIGLVGPTTTIGASSAGRLTITSQILGGTPLVFQGATDNSFATSLVISDPTANRTIILPNADGTICLSSGNCPTGGNGDVLQGGNNFGANMTIGTNDDFSLSFKTNNTDRFTISNVGNASLTGSLNISGDSVLGTDGTNRITFNGQIVGGTPLVFQGATNDSYTTSLVISDPTANRTIILPNADGTICLSSGNCAGGGGYGDVLQGGNNFGATMVLGTNDNNAFQLKTNNVTKVTIDTSGLVNVVDSIRTSSRITIGTGIRYQSSSSEDVFTISTYNPNGTPGGQPITFALDAPGTNVMTERLRILSTGRVGIGTASPSALLHLLNDTAGTPVAIVQGAAGQTANLQEWRDSNGTAYAWIAATQGGTHRIGNLQIASASGGTGLAGLAGGGVYRQFISINSSDLVSTGAVGGTYIFGGSGNYIGVDAFDPGILINGGTNADTRVLAGSAARIGIIIKGATSQTANLQEWQNNAGTALAGVDALGIGYFPALYQGGYEVCDTSGNCSGTGGYGNVLQGGNSFATTMVLGTNDNNALAFETNGTSYFTLTTAGVLQGSNGATISVPGTGTNSEQFGLGASATGASSLAVGNGASAGGSNATAIGLSASAGYLRSTAVGAFATTGNQDTVAIGHGASAAHIYSIAIGRGAASVGDTSVSIGQEASASNKSIALGANAVAGQSNSIAIGRQAATTATNQLVIGSTGAAISQGFFGNGVTAAAPQSFTLNATGGSGTDIAGANLLFAGGRGTGTGVGGDILFQTAAAGGATGSSLNALTERMRITSAGNVGIAVNNPSAKLHVLGTTRFSVAGIATASSISDSTNFLQSDKGTVSVFIGTAGNVDTSSYGVNESSGNIRFNGRNVGWGDFGYYPTGGGDGNYGSFRFSVSGSNIETVPDAKVGVGQLYSAGSVGIGTTSPGNLLSVGTLSTAKPGVQVAISTGGISNQGLIIQGVAGQESSLQQWQDSTGTPLVLVAADGRIGSTTAQAGGTNSRDTTVRTGNSLVSGDSGALYLGTGDATSGNSGNIYLGTGTASTVAGSVIVKNAQNFADAFQVQTASGGRKVFTVDTTSTTNVAQFNGTGGTQCIVVAGTGWSCSSDERLKTNITAIDPTDALAKINQLQSVTYNWMSDPSGVSQSGFIAQAVQQVLPELVTTDSNGYLSLNQQGLLPYVIGAVQQQQQQITGLQQQVNQANQFVMPSDASFANLNISGNASFANLTVTGSASIGANLTVGGSLSVAGTISTQTLKVNGKIIGNPDTRGTLTIQAGAVQAEYAFAVPYDEIPNIVATPTGNPGSQYWVSDITKTGFKVNLASAPVANIDFNFQAQQ